MNFEDVKSVWDIVMFDRLIGVDGHCKCRRPGYDRRYPENCRWCHKPFREIYLERSRRGEIVSYEEQSTRRVKAETERELAEYKAKYGDGDPFSWLESLSRDDPET